MIKKKTFNKILRKVTEREIECFIMVKCEDLAYKDC